MSAVSREVVKAISKMKNEPEWMLDFRLRALDHFLKRPMPNWGGDLSAIDFENIYYYIKPAEKQGNTWDDVPGDSRTPSSSWASPRPSASSWPASARSMSRSGLSHLREDLEAKGVIFLDIDSGLREYPDLVKEHFGTVIPANDNKFAALNSAVWSGGSFIYVPKGVSVNIPLQAYFRINAQNMGQFERTLIIADEGSYVHYVEGCTAPIWSTDSLHSAVVEIIVKEGARALHDHPELVEECLQPGDQAYHGLRRMRRWSGSTATWAQADHEVPVGLPDGQRRQGEILSIAFAGNGQHQDAGGKAIHVAPNTTSTITSKSIRKGTGRATYRGLLKVEKGAEGGSKSNVRCDALLLDETSRPIRTRASKSTRTMSPSGTRQRSARSATSRSSICAAVA